jgi:subtilisin family serine protease
VVVAILDTGANLCHVALRSHFIKGYNAIDSAQPPLDLPNGTTNIGAGHGTFIAGIVAQMAPEAMIMPVKVLDSEGVGTLFNVVEGLHYAVNHGARVINMSFGSPKDLPALADAVQEAKDAGIVLVASAGNTGCAEYHYPAAYAGVMAVSAVDEGNVKPAFANFGDHIFVVAPGTNIRSTYWTGGYATWSGTSFSAPFVTGQVALLLGMNPGLDRDSVHELIRGTAVDITDINPDFKGLLGNGIIDVQAAIFRFP